MPAVLSVPMEEAESVLARHIDEGREFLVRLAGSEETYEEWKRRRRQWVELTREGLTHVYSSDVEADEFSRAARPKKVLGGVHWTQEYEWYFMATQSAVDALESLKKRLFYAVAPGAPPATPPSTPPAPVSGNTVIFLVHGHDHATREEVARFLEKRGSHDVMILDEQPGKSMTLIEKLEHYASGAGHAVVLFTADDVGAAKGVTSLAPRARENVVLELGWFCGHLGRAGVTLLHATGVDVPSDFAGVSYVPLDADWKTKLVDELTAAGLDMTPRR
jgi:predicted nucleotide-binding protein